MLGRTPRGGQWVHYANPLAQDPDPGLRSAIQEAARAQGHVAAMLEALLTSFQALRVDMGLDGTQPLLAPPSPPRCPTDASDPAGGSAALAAPGVASPVVRAGSPTSTERHYNRLSAEAPGVLRNQALLSHLLRNPERAQRLSHVAAEAVATPAAVGALPPPVQPPAGTAAAGAVASPGALPFAAAAPDPPGLAAPPVVPAVVSGCGGGHSAARRRTAGPPGDHDGGGSDDSSSDGEDDDAWGGHGRRRPTGVDSDDGGVMQSYYTGRTPVATISTAPRKVFDCTAVQISNDDLGLALAQKLRKARQYLLARSNNDQWGTTPYSLHQHVAANLAADLLDAWASVQATVVHRIAVVTGVQRYDQPIHPQYLPRAVRAAMEQLQTHLLSSQPAELFAVLTSMRMGESSLGCPDVPSTERPSTYIGRFTMLARDRQCAQIATPVQLIEAFSQGLPPLLRDHWDTAHSTALNRLRRHSVAAFAAFVASKREELDNYWYTRLRRQAASAAPAAAARADGRSERRWPRALRKALATAAAASGESPDSDDSDGAGMGDLIALAAAAAASLASGQRKQQILQQLHRPSAGAPASAATGSAAAPAVPAPARPLPGPPRDSQGGAPLFRGYCRVCNGWGHRAVDCPTTKAVAAAAAADPGLDGDDADAPAYAAPDMGETAMATAVGPCARVADAAIGGAAAATFNGYRMPVSFAPSQVPLEAGSALALHVGSAVRQVLYEVDPAAVHLLEGSLASRSAPSAPAPADTEGGGGVQAGGDPPADPPAAAEPSAAGPAASQLVAARAVRRVPAPVSDSEEGDPILFADGAAALATAVFAPGLFFHKQDCPAEGVRLTVQTVGGGQATVMPPRVLHDSGASCNLISDAYARQVGAERVPVCSSLNGSAGPASPISEAVWADITVAGDTPHQQTASRQLFYVATNDKLYDALIGNGPTAFGPLQSHVDGVDHHYHYTTALGHRHALPMVTRQRGCVAQSTGAAAAAVEEPEQLYVFAARVEAERARPGGCF